MEKQIATFKDYAIFMADKTSLLEIAQFVVKENYSHHLSSFTEKEVNEDINQCLKKRNICMITNLISILQGMPLGI